MCPRCREGSGATEKDLEREVERLRPRLFGGICRALQEALRHPEHRADDLPRMADFANFIDAAQAAFPADLPPLIKAMANLHDQMAHERAAASPVAVAMLAALKKTADGRLEGDMTTWHTALKRHRPSGMSWPRNVQAFRSALHREEPVLMHLGVDVRPDGKDPVTRRARYVATLHVEPEEEHDASDRSDPSGKEENAGGVSMNGASPAKDRRGTGEGSDGGATDPSERDLPEWPVNGASEGSKDAKDTVPDRGSPLRSGLRVRLLDGREGTVTPSRDSAGHPGIYTGIGDEAETVYADAEELEVVCSW